MDERYEIYREEKLWMYMCEVTKSRRDVGKQKSQSSVENNLRKDVHLYTLSRLAGNSSFSRSSRVFDCPHKYCFHDLDLEF